MKLSTIIALAAVVCGATFIASSSAEAKVHFGFGFNTSAVQERVVVPQVYERVVVPAYPYYGPVYVAPRPVYQEVYVVPGYRERVRTYPRASFSIGFWR